MTEYERRKIEIELRAFASRNFEKPSECKNIEQIQFYIRELCSKMQETEREFNYVPGWAYSLLAQYNARQNMMIHVEFKNAYR